MSAHRWAKEIHAWADGAVIQGRSDQGSWTDIDHPDSTPQWNRPGNEFRVKPEGKVLRYRVALLSEGDGVFASCVQSDEDIGALEKYKDYGFVRWLTDWTEVSL